MKKLFFLTVLLPTLAFGEGVSKIAGVAFRFDDNPPTTEKYREIDAVFARHKANYCLAPNLAAIADKPEFGEFFRKSVGAGNELIDHTVSHSCYQVRNTPETLSRLKNDPGVDHVNPGFICLKYEAVPGCQETNFKGSVRNGNQLELPPHIETMLLKFAVAWHALWIVPRGECYRIMRSPDAKSLYLQSLWGENITLPELENVDLRLVPKNDGVRPADNAMRLAMRENALCLKRLGLPPETLRVFVQPGGFEPFLRMDELKRIYVKEFGYRAADRYTSKKHTFCDPAGADKAFELSPDFDCLETVAPEALKMRIADSFARHEVTLYISHMKTAQFPDGLKEFLRRHDELLAWLNAAGIPVRTYSEWAELLTSPTRRAENIMPSFGTDLDGNGRPDGFEPLPAGVSVRDGILSAENAGTAFRLQDLGGIEKGRNILAGGLSGPAGGKVIFLLQKKVFKGRTDRETIEFTLTGNKVEKFEREFNVAPDVLLLDLEATVPAGTKIHSLTLCGK